VRGARCGPASGAHRPPSARAVSDAALLGEIVRMHANRDVVHGLYGRA
jgi:hypothetical protein